MKSHPIESFGIAPAKSGDIRVDLLEQRLKPRVPFPHKHDFYHILLVTKGSGWHEIDFVRYQIRPGQLFVMKPAEVHSWKLGPTTRGFVLEFTAESLPAMVRSRFVKMLHNLPSHFEPQNYSQWAEICSSMVQELQQRQDGYFLCLEGLLQFFLVKLFRLREEKNSRKDNDIFVQRFKALVEANFRREHSVDFYAEKMGLTAKALTMRITRGLGKPARSLIQERCMLEAKRLLVYSDSSIAQIAYSLGYEDPNYFARFFTSQNKIAPGRFRKLAQKTIF